MAIAVSPSPEGENFHLFEGKGSLCAIVGFSRLPSLHLW